MNTDKVEVKDSNIEGKGVFALRDFKKGEEILCWDISNVISKEKVDKMSTKEERYVSFINGVYVVMQSPEKYVNHSCDSNTKIENFSDIAIKDIKKGEEITGDYGEDLPLNCNCGSKKCRRAV